MMKEVYHPKFRDDLAFLMATLGRKRFRECLLQIDHAIEQILRSPTKMASLKYPPLTGFRKKKFFSISRPHMKQRPDMRLIYRDVAEENTIYFLAVGLRIAQKPRNPNDVYQRSRSRDLFRWD